MNLEPPLDGPAVKVFVALLAVLALHASPAVARPLAPAVDVSAEAGERRLR